MKLDKIKFGKYEILVIGTFLISFVSILIILFSNPAYSLIIAFYDVAAIILWVVIGPIFLKKL
jgi:hypothetical protein